MLIWLGDLRMLHSDEVAIMLSEENLLGSKYLDDL